jgi:hypothetical protein
VVLLSMVLAWASVAHAEFTFRVTQHYGHGRKVVRDLQVPGQYRGEVPGRVAEKMAGILRREGGPKSIALTHVSKSKVTVGNYRGMTRRHVHRHLLRPGDTRDVILAQLRYGRTAMWPRGVYAARGNVPGAKVRWPDRRFRTNSVVLETRSTSGPRALTTDMYQAKKSEVTTLLPPLEATPR